MKCCMNLQYYGMSHDLCGMVLAVLRVQLSGSDGYSQLNGCQNNPPVSLKNKKEQKINDR